MIHLPSLLAFLRTVCHPCRAADAAVDRMVAAALDDDLTALAEAAGVLREADADPVYVALRAKFAAIEAACEDWAAEVQALADVELAEMCEGWSE